MTVRSLKETAGTAVFLLAIGLICLAPGSLEAQYDILIRGGRVLDGSGNPWRYADVAINGDEIVAVGNLRDATAERVIDATGKYVTPGFVDVHSHAGPGLTTEDLSGAEALLTQGITTVFVNPDGGGRTDMPEQEGAFLAHGLGVNVAQLVPHGAVRRQVLGMADRAPTAAELDQMRALTRQGMEAGAFGLSSGLYYAPGSYAETDEVVALAEVAAEFGGVYISHIRDEADYNIGVVAAVDEVIEIARRAQLPGIVSHIKALGPRVWGYSGPIIQRINAARQEGVEVFADQYPYEASGTGIGGALIPRWAQVGGQDSLVARINDPATRELIRRDVIENLDRRGGADRLQFRRYRPDESVEGRTMADVAREWGLHPADLALEMTKQGGASLVSFNMHDDDIAALMKQPWTMTSSDGGLTPMGVGVPHPRYYGTYPRRIRKYVFEEGVTDLRSAVRSMTSLPASVMRVAGRGQLEAGARADVLVYEPEQLMDHATYDDPHHYSTGMDYVIVNGGIAIDAGELTGLKFGRVLKRNADGRPTS